MTSSVKCHVHAIYIVEIIGKTEDIAEVVVTKNLLNMEETCSTTIHIIKEWMGAKLVDQKTEAVLMISRKK